MNSSLIELAQAVREAEIPNRDLDRAIWQECNPEAALRSQNVAPSYTNDPAAARSLLPDFAITILSERTAAAEFLTTISVSSPTALSGPIHIEARHRHRFLATCLAVLEVLIYLGREARSPLQ